MSALSDFRKDGDPTAKPGISGDAPDSLITSRPGFTIVETGTIAGEGEGGTIADNLRRSSDTFKGYVRILNMNPVQLILHEQPMPAFRGRTPESSIMAATALHCAVVATGWQPYPEIVIIQPKQMKLRVAGNQQASKKEVAAAVRLIIPEITNFKPLNENVYDAVGIALAGVPDDFYGMVLSTDQSLSAAGWVLISVRKTDG